MKATVLLGTTEDFTSSLALQFDNGCTLVTFQKLLWATPEERATIIHQFHEVLNHLKTLGLQVENEQALDQIT
jgi:hypothetical protein